MLGGRVWLLPLPCSFFGQWPAAAFNGVLALRAKSRVKQDEAVRTCEHRHLPPPPPAANFALCVTPPLPVRSSPCSDPPPPPPRPLYGSFVRPLVDLERTAACRRCSGSGFIDCPACQGRGRLPRGGYQKRNPVNASRVVGGRLVWSSSGAGCFRACRAPIQLSWACPTCGPSVPTEHLLNADDIAANWPPFAGSRWTAMERTLGWRHFQAVQKRGQGRDAFVLLESTCDRDTKLWVRPDASHLLATVARWNASWGRQLQRKSADACACMSCGSGAGCRCGAPHWACICFGAGETPFITSMRPCR